LLLWASVIDGTIVEMWSGAPASIPSLQELSLVPGRKIPLSSVGLWQVGAKTPASGKDAKASSLLKLMLIDQILSNEAKIGCYEVLEFDQNSNT
jgi:hypothetical protein